MNDDKAPPHLKVVYDEDSEEVQTLYETNFRDIPAKLRQLADDIEANEYGAVGEVACVLMGDSLEVFGWGPQSDGGSASLLLQAGNLKMVRCVADHKNNTKDRMK